MRLMLLTLSILMFDPVLANDSIMGYAIVKSDTIYGKIQINFESGSVLVKQDSINRMFINDVESIILLNKSRDTYRTILKNGKQVFYKELVAGKMSLLERHDELFTLKDDQLILIDDEKVLYDLFGKKAVKEYCFVRDVSTTSRLGIIDIFQYFNIVEI